MSEYNPADLFSIVFYFACITYVVFGLYTLFLNPSGNLNRVFFVTCLATAVWAFAFSMGNAALDNEDALFWRRVATIGWGTTYSILLYFFLLLTNRKKILKHKFTYIFIYLPVVINIVFFSLYSPIAKMQYHMVQIETGWINISPKGLWDTYFNLYYITFTLMGIYAVWNWKKNVKNSKEKMTALIISITLLVSIGLGTLTDIILNAYFSFEIPQLGVVFALISIAGVFYSIKRHGLMRDKDVSLTKEGNILGQLKRIQLYKYVVGIFITGSILNLAHYFYFTIEVQTVIFFSASLLFIGTLVAIIPLTKLDKNLQDLLLFILLSLTMFLILMRFARDYGSNIVWPIPLIFMLLSAMFKKRLYFMIILLTSLFTQWLTWIWTPEITINVSKIDYLSRLVLYSLFGLLVYYVNQIYRNRLEENETKIDLQKLLSEISLELVCANIENLDNKLDLILQKSGNYFSVDRAYLVQISEDLSTATYTHEWCAQDILPGIEKIGSLPTENFSWWSEQLKGSKPLYISDTTSIPKDAGSERALLEEQQVKSLISVPLVSKEKVVGFLGFDSVRGIKVWEKYHREVLQIMANVISDALIKVRAEKEINYMAYYDVLTGLSNRALFKSHLEKAISLAGRSEKLIGVLFLDLDSFKAVNDTMGHEAGDMLLKEVAQRLLKCVRRYDTVCRFGGDEFLVMFPQIENQEQIKQAGKKIMSVFKEPVIINGQEFYITASAGVSVWPVDGQDSETLIKSADLAMYASKDHGKNQVTFCSLIMREAVNEKMQLTNDLYRALEREELLLYYQPQVQIETGKIVGLEALIRWQHPTRGMVSPVNFIPLAEQTGLIHPIGEWVLKTACCQNKAWQDMGLTPVVMAVNLSVEQFRTPSLTKVVAKALNETGLSPKYLDLEITEGIAIRESDYIIPILNSLKELGVAISIDDFGTEYSSLSRLKELPIDRIKMAMEFVQGIEKGTKDEAIAMVIINLAKSLGLRVIAEGVETIGQFQFLVKGVCDEVQGYYFHRPMPAEEVEMIMREGA